MIDYRNTDSGKTKQLRTPRTSPRGRQATDGDSMADHTALSSVSDAEEASVVMVKVVFAPHQLIHDRACVDQVRPTEATAL